MKRQVDKTKKSNIKCEHCIWWCVDTTNKYLCGNVQSDKYNESTHYYNRCKCFEWRENIG